MQYKNEIFSQKSEGGLTEKQKSYQKLQDAILKSKVDFEAGLGKISKKKKEWVNDNHKPGEEDYPTKKLLKKHSLKNEKDYAAEEFKPHIMYDPKTGKGYS